MILEFWYKTNGNTFQPLVSDKQLILGLSFDVKEIYAVYFTQQQSERYCITNSMEILTKLSTKVIRLI